MRKKVYSIALTSIKQEIWRARCSTIDNKENRSTRQRANNLQYRLKDIYDHDFKKLGNKALKRKWGAWKYVRRSVYKFPYDAKRGCKQKGVITRSSQGNEASYNPYVNQSSSVTETRPRRR